MAARFKRQADRTPVWFMHEEGKALADAPRSGVAPDGVTIKPTPTQLADPRCAPDRARIAEGFRQALLDAVQAGSRSPKPPAPAEAVAQLAEIHARLRDPEQEGEVLPQVLAFAAQLFSRVVLFMIRDSEAAAIAQRGLPSAGGPGDASLRSLHLPSRDAAWFRHVLDAREPLRGAPTDEGDHRLAVMLGNEIPPEAWLAPIESGGHVVAVLYGDNLPSRAPIGDTAALEVVLSSAGIALDRAVLERALEDTAG